MRQPLFQVRGRLSLCALSCDGFWDVPVGGVARDKADILKNSGVINGICADLFQDWRVADPVAAGGTPFHTAETGFSRFLG